MVKSYLLVETLAKTDELCFAWGSYIGEVVFPLINLQLGRIFKYGQQAIQAVLLGTEG